MSSSTTIAPFSRAVVNAMRKLYPEDLADKKWDNTGLLLEAPFDPARRQRNSVLLTIDLTKAVANEAIERKDSIIIAYHPIIFRGLKALTLADTQQQSLLRLAAAGISVYSPHTAIDAAPGGLGDWLADIVTGQETFPEKASAQQPTPSATTPKDPFIIPQRPTFQLQHLHSTQSSSPALRLGATAHTRKAIKPLDHPTHAGAGMGRIVTFSTPQPLSTLIARIAQGVGNPKGFPIAIPQGKSIAEISVSSVGICAGSGGSLLNGLDVDVLFTGELSHHEALAAIERGQCVVALFHSNTERGFLEGVLQGQLVEAVVDEWEAVRAEGGKDEGEGWMEALAEEGVSVDVSTRDRDPYGILVSEEA